MPVTDFIDMLRELMDKAGDFPVMLWVDDEPMPIISANEDGDGFCLDATSDRSEDALLASDIIATIEDIGYEMTEVYAIYECEAFEGYRLCEPVGVLVLMRSPAQSICVRFNKLHERSRPMQVGRLLVLSWVSYLCILCENFCRIFCSRFLDY